MRITRCHGITERLIQFRRTNRMTAAQLAHSAGISPQALGLIEKGKVMPSMETIERLAHAMQLDPGWLGYGSGAGIGPQITVTPKFDPDKLVADLLAILKGSSGVVDDVYKYLDPVGAHEWRAMLRQPEFGQLLSSLPLNDLIDCLTNILDTDQACDVVGLGCGTAEREIALIRKLIGRRRRDLRLILIDISVNLLSFAVQNSDAFSKTHAVPVLALLGNFHALPEYAHLMTGDHQRRRVITMFGYTFSNLDNEVQFLRRSMSWVNHDDLLILDIPAAATASSDPAEIARKDGALARRKDGDWHRTAFQFLTGPLRRNLEQVIECKVHTELDQSSCVIPGSYAIRHKATVKFLSGAEKRFVIGYTKRYDPDKLGQHMEREGWRLLHRLSYGTDGLGLVAIFQRTDPPKPKRGRKPKHA